MNARTLAITGLLTLGMSLGGAAISSAQHHHHGGISTHRSGFHLYSPHGAHVTQQHHHDYHYVVPSHHHHGTFYNYQGTHYYTPPVQRVVVNRPVVVQKPVAIEFGSFAHFEPLAERLDVLTNQFCLDLHYNYQHNANYREVYRESYQLLSLAKYLHGSEHRGDRGAIVREAEGLDKLFHHIAGEVRNWRREDNRQIGAYGLPAKLEEMEAIIHHLLYDIGIKPVHDIDEAAPPPADEAAPPPVGGAALPPPAGVRPSLQPPPPVTP